jgi:hypothetical protein
LLDDNSDTTIQPVNTMPSKAVHEDPFLSIEGSRVDNISFKNRLDRQLAILSGRFSPYLDHRDNRDDILLFSFR